MPPRRPGCRASRLQRIERGEPSVTMGAYIGAATAVGPRARAGRPARAPARHRRRARQAAVSGAHPPRRLPAAEEARLAAARRGDARRPKTRSASTSATGATSTPPRSIPPSARSSPRWRSISAAGGCLFERPHHRRIAARARTRSTPTARRATPAGSAAAPRWRLRYGEYRESVDIDFLVSEREGLPRAARAAHRRRPACSRSRRPARCSRPRARCAPTSTASAPLLRSRQASTSSSRSCCEGRIALEAPGAADRVCGVATLTPLDMAASKLLANSDRWADDAVMSRDLIDLAMMQPDAALFRRRSPRRRRPTARASLPISTRRSRRCAPARIGSTAAWRRCR